ncbi:MAG: MATE family efflux transporter [Lachnospiraceae bacterium]|nr:MATE family efflux transporter [Lachnospiraceae bacterium]
MDNVVKKDNKEYIKKAIKIAWPAVLESFFVALVGMVDSLMVSSLGEDAVASVGLTTQPKFLFLAIFIAVNIAVSAVVARRKGEDDRVRANKTLLFAICFTVVLGIIVSVVAFMGAEFFMTLSGAEADTKDNSVLYFRIIMGGILFNIVSLVINAALRGAGNTKIAMRTNLTSNLVNVACNYLLINGNLGCPALGIKGAAIATVIGTVVACTMSICSVFKKDQFVSLAFCIKEKLKPDFSEVKAIAKIGGSAFLEQILLRIGFMSVAVMAAKQGTDDFAAHQVAMNCMALSFSFGDGMQVAAVSLIGQSLGQKKPELAKTYGKICRRMGMCIAVVLAMLYFTCGEFYFNMFFPKAEQAHIVAIGIKMMRVIAVVVTIQIAQVIYMGCLRGAGDVLFTTIASTVSVTCLRPISSFLFCYTFGFGILGIWFGLIADQICRYVLTSWRFQSGKWANVKI